MKKKVPTEKEIAKKHGVSLDYVTRQAEIGSTVEREHVTTHEEAYGIALQHIMEFPDYYKHLLPMEKKLKSEWNKKKTGLIVVCFILINDRNFPFFARKILTHFIGHYRTTCTSANDQQFLHSLQLFIY